MWASLHDNRHFLFLQEKNQVAPGIKLVQGAVRFLKSKIKNMQQLIPKPQDYNISMLNMIDKSEKTDANEDKEIKI